MSAAAGPGPQPADAGARPPFPFRWLFFCLVGGRGIDPIAFWRLSVPEVAALLGLGEAGADASVGAADLRRLLERFPDER